MDHRRHWNRLAEAIDVKGDSVIVIATLWVRNDDNRAAIFAAVTDPIRSGFEPLEITMPDPVCRETFRTAVVRQFLLFDGQVTASAAQFCGLGREQNQFPVFAL